MSIWNSAKALASTWAEAKKHELQQRSGTPDTLADSGGGVSAYEFNGQEIDRSDLRDVKEMRESGGVVTTLYHMKALMKFGTGAELQSENDDLQEWLNEEFRHLDDTVLDLGEDALWFPYGLGEGVPTQSGDGFSHVELVEPWTMLPQTNEFGEIVLWEQKRNGERDPRPHDPDDIGSIILNKSSGRDKTGISEVLRNKEEITQWKENQRAINKAIEIAGFPHHIWTVGAEGASVINDTELRRVRNLIDDMDGDTQFVVGPDVEHDKITPSDFDFASITERDLRILTSAIGVPFELVGYGSDGLGSGHEAELKLQMLAIQNEADRRRFGQQFVEQFVRPVVRQYSPYSEDEDITLQIDPFLDDKSELWQKIEKVGEYMRNDQIVEELDLPPIEDEEIAKSYRSPEKHEAPEEEVQDGPFGGMFEDGGSGNRHLADGIKESAPEWDRPYLEMLEQVAWAEDTTRSLTAFSESQLPDMVKERLREAIRGGAVFSDIDGMGGSDLIDLRQELADELTDDGWTLDELSQELSDRFGMSEDRAELVARTETASTVNTARQEAYEERGLGDERFYWVGTSDNRTTEACSWLKDQTHPDHGGTPVQMDELKELIEEAPSHDPEMQDNLARPDNFVVHPNERHTWVRHVE